MNGQLMLGHQTFNPGALSGALELAGEAREVEAGLY
jgi:hypothetical protein